MLQQLKTVVTIQPGGRIEIPASDLPEGQQAEIFATVVSEVRPKDCLALFGTAGEHSRPRKKQIGSCAVSETHLCGR